MMFSGWVEKESELLLGKRQEHGDKTCKNCTGTKVHWAKREDLHFSSLGITLNNYYLLL